MYILQSHCGWLLLRCVVLSHSVFLGTAPSGVIVSWVWQGCFDCLTKNGVKTLEVSKMFGEEFVDCWWFSQPCQLWIFFLDEILQMALRLCIIVYDSSTFMVLPAVFWVFIQTLYIHCSLVWGQFSSCFFFSFSGMLLKDGSLPLVLRQPCWWRWTAWVVTSPAQPHSSTTSTAQTAKPTPSPCTPLATRRKEGTRALPRGIKLPRLAKWQLTHVMPITWEKPAMAASVWWHPTGAIPVRFSTGLRPAHRALFLPSMVVLPQSTTSQLQNVPYMMNPQ